METASYIHSLAAVGLELMTCVPVWHHVEYAYSASLQPIWEHLPFNCTDDNA